MDVSRSFWGAQGRIGRIRRGEWAGRWIFVYPDTLEGWWTFVVHPSPQPRVPGDFYIPTTEDMAVILDGFDVEWMPKDDEESKIEFEHFRWRPLRGLGGHWLD
jgi:hypothetical protein